MLGGKDSVGGHVRGEDPFFVGDNPFRPRTCGPGVDTDSIVASWNTFWPVKPTGNDCATSRRNRCPHPSSSIQPIAQLAT